MAEVAYCLSMNYEIIPESITEVIYYSQGEHVFSKFFKILASLKIRNNGLPNHLETEDQIKDYLEQLNKSMGFTDEFSKLGPSDFTTNKPMANFYKLISNSILGLHMFLLFTLSREIGCRCPAYPPVSYTHLTLPTILLV